MIDLKVLRNEPDLVRAAIRDKGANVDLDLVLELDRDYVALLREVEEVRAERNRVSSSISGKPDEATIATARALREQLASMEAELAEKKKAFFTAYKQVPNIPTHDTPVGHSEDENQVVRRWGERREFPFPAKNHYEIALHHDWIDKERAAKVAGSRFAYIKGDLVKLQFALISLVFDKMTDEGFIGSVVKEAGLDISTRPFLPILPPYMIRTDIYDAMDRLEPVEERYRIDGEDLWLQGSAEHVIGSMHAEEILEEADMPLRYLGYATSFRSEAGAAGKDLEGIIRLHQFDKIEMESFTSPETSHAEHLLLSAIQERLMQLLRIPYQKLQKCTFDIGKPNAKGSDIEAWLPGQQKYRETHTADYMTDYQARRLNTRVRRQDGTLEFVHTNDATAFACGRTMVAIIENFQNEDMTVDIPEVLQGYMGGRTRIG
ncbi:serine--tRNA ligase [Bauldia litoralis]|uniref:Serine--tRNA ligase n=1 Tax=Bauldia litoralis TaxID=665467 RepID=A0A1G6EN29_9HYPH|nr:serine--tRNA ligase [Bauldia litoralis]SDB58838.1 seryl-tRNA synthetase [Bauldia litoralis]